MKLTIILAATIIAAVLLLYVLRALAVIGRATVGQTVSTTAPATANFSLPLWFRVMNPRARKVGRLKSVELKHEFGS